MIRVERAGPVAVIAAADHAPLSRADLAYALALRDAVRDTADHDDVKALVLQADGASFAPPSTDADRARAAEVRQRERALWHAACCAPSGLYQTLAYCRKPLVTAVRGHCGPAGSLLVLCSDHTVCADDARFESPYAELPEANLVLAALTVRLNRAKSWLLGGQPWHADVACSAGLVNRVVPAADVAAQALQAAAAAARMTLDGLAMSKLLFEAFLDTQGVGQDFDMAGLYADALHAAHRSPQEAS